MRHGATIDIQLADAFFVLPEQFKRISTVFRVISAVFKRVLRRLVQKELLMHIGYGLYARAKISSLSGVLIPEKPLPYLACAALTRLGIEVTPSKADLDYNSGKSA